MTCTTGVDENMPTETPHVSVLMSAYNAGRYIAEAVDSILGQTFNNFEFIIINDGSTDQTPGILSSFHDRRLCIITRPRTGLTAALAEGLNRARGSYIARIDADDRAAPHRLEKQVRFLDRHPEVVALFSNCYCIDEQGAIVRHTRVPVDEAHLKWILLFRNCFHHSTVMFRRAEVLKLGGYNGSPAVAQDYDLWLRVALHHHMAVLPEPLACYRLPRPGTITLDRGEQQQCQARALSAAALKALCPALSQPDVELVRELIVGRTATTNTSAAERVLGLLHSAFCSSAYAAGIDPVHLRGVMCDPLATLAWSYADQGLWEDFKRCLLRYLECGGAVPVDVPRACSPALVEQLVRVLCDHFMSNRRDRPRRQLGRAVIGAQYVCCAWSCYAVENLRLFRALMRKALLVKPTLKTGLLLMASLSGKSGMQALLHLRRRTSHRAKAGEP